MTSPITVLIQHTPSYFVVVLSCTATGAERWQRRFPAMLWEMLPADDIADLLADAYLQEHPEQAADVLFRAQFTADIQLALEPEGATYIAR
jgi:hypothetical protein